MNQSVLALCSRRQIWSNAMSEQLENQRSKCVLSSLLCLVDSESFLLEAMLSLISRSDAAFWATSDSSAASLASSSRLFWAWSSISCNSVSRNKPTYLEICPLWRIDPLSSTMWFDCGNIWSLNDARYASGDFIIFSWSSSDANSWHGLCCLILLLLVEILSPRWLGRRRRCDVGIAILNIDGRDKTTSRHFFIELWTLVPVNEFCNGLQSLSIFSSTVTFRFKSDWAPTTFKLLPVILSLVPMASWAQNFLIIFAKDQIGWN